MQKIAFAYFIFFYLTIFINWNSYAQPLHYFKNTYEESDRHFTELFNTTKKTNTRAVIHQFQYSEGTIKSYFFPARLTQQSLLIVISGTHGIEGHAGSAIQRWLLDQKINTDKTAILMIHGFNLYGFKNFRRVNENNIDLNRNFILARGQFQSNDQSYSQLGAFLNPGSAPELSTFSRFNFLVRSVFNICVHSLESLRSSILKGQYTYPNGVFYGGSQTEVQSHLITDLIQTFMKPYKKIFLIDLHTGYGERAKLHLLAGKSTSKNSAALLKVFSKDEVDFADKKKFYAVSGELLTYLIDKIKLNIDAEVSGITFEYGTLDSQRTMGSIESLRRIILENQNFHHPAKVETANEIKTLFKEMFYPADEAWRAAILTQSEEKFKKIFKYLNN